MPDLLIRNMSVEMKSRIRKQAREDNTSLSEATKTLIEKGFGATGKRRLLGTEMFDLLPAEFRSDDLVFEMPDLPDEPPDFS